MAVAHPDELKEPALRRLAAELSVPEAGRNVAQILGDMQAQHPGVSLILAPVNASPAPVVPATRDWVGILTITATALTALFTVAIAWANWKSADASHAVVMQSATDKEEAKKTSWQTHKVYEIIDDAGKEAKDFKGVSFDEIMTKYRSASLEPEEKVMIGKEELKPFALRKILTELQVSGLIYKTWENHYIAQRTPVNTRAANLRAEVANKALMEILKILRDRSGQITDKELEKEVKQKYRELHDEDYLFSMYQLAAQNLISIDDKERVWAALRPPPKK